MSELTYRMTLYFDDDAASDGWCGDTPLDPDKSWTPYAALLEIYDGQADKNEFVDSVGAIWASDDSEGRAYAIETAIGYLCPEGVDAKSIVICGI